MGFFKKFKEAWLASMTFDRLDDDFYEELEEALILADADAYDRAEGERGRIERELKALTTRIAEAKAERERAQAERKGAQDAKRAARETLAEQKRS